MLWVLFTHDAHRDIFVDECSQTRCNEHNTYKSFSADGKYWCIGLKIHSTCSLNNSQSFACYVFCITKAETNKIQHCSLLLCCLQVQRAWHVLNVHNLQEHMSNSHRYFFYLIKILQCADLQAIKCIHKKSSKLRWLFLLQWQVTTGIYNRSKRSSLASSHKQCDSSLDQC